MLSRDGIIIFMTCFIIYLFTSSLLKYSHTPSDATTINLSSSVILNSSISGSDITPAYAPTLSPKLLVIANPGASIYDNQTLSGPIGLP